MKEEPMSEKDSSSPKCNQQYMLQHLQLISDATGNSDITVQIFDSKGQRQARSLEVKADRGSVKTLARYADDGYTVAVVPQVTDGRGRRKENVTAICFLVVDIDRQMRKSEFKKTVSDVVKPAFAVESSTERFHAYFPVKCDVDQYEKCARALAIALNADRQATDRNRAFRLAGTINWKKDRSCFVAELCIPETPTERLHAQEVVDLFGGLLTKQPTDSAKQVDFRPRSQLAVDEVEKHLDVIPSDERGLWLHIGMALHDWDSSERGFAVWDAWSKRSPEKYQENTQRQTWNGFKSGEGVTVRTLVYHAKRFGENSMPEESGAWLPVTDNDIVEYAIVELRDRLKVVDREFYIFNDSGWRKDRKGAARALLDVVKTLLDVARKAGNAKAVQALRKQAGFANANRMLEGLLAYPELDAADSDFDANPRLLGVPHGVVNLHTGNLHHAKPAHMVSRSTNVVFDSDAMCPTFVEFIDQITETENYREYLQTVLGYLLVGHSNEQKAFFMLGRGSNGKGTLTRAIQNVLGTDYCTTISTAFMKNASKGNGNGPSPAVMSLQNVRTAFCTETEQKSGIDEPFFKQLTGGDSLTGRHNYGEQETFKPQCKLLISTNAMPDWRYEDEALWRRVVVLPFTRQFKGKHRNNNLDDELAAEASGILNWMIEGAKRYLERGLGTCPEVKDATNNAHRSADTVQIWIDTEGRIGDDLKISGSEAYEAYIAFAEKRQFAPLTQKRFSTRMRALGYSSTRTSRSVVYKGLALFS